MGASLSWVGVQAKSARQLLDALGMVDTGEVVAPGQCEIAATQLPNGWFVIVCNQFWHRLVQPAAMQQASRGRELFGYSEYEAVNTALAFQYRNGAQVWQLSHVLDEGRDHLAVEGTAPAVTKSLLAAAIQAAAREGNDAVFSVPGEVVRQVSGIAMPAGSNAIYHRLAPDPAAIWPETEDQMQAQLTGLLAQAFAPLGFVRVAKDPRGSAWDSLLRENAVGTQYIRPFVWERDEGGYTCDAWLEIRDKRVEQVIERFTPHDAGKPTATLRFSSSASESDLVVDSPARLKAFVRQLESQFVALLPRTADMRQLDTLVNGDAEEVDFMKMLESYAPFIIAWLGHNPNFENMIARADERITPDPDDPVSNLMHMAAYLRTQARP
jgi:hypothetical protein